jgi:hypothetical protein
MKPVIAIQIVQSDIDEHYKNILITDLAVGIDKL